MVVVRVVFSVVSGSGGGGGDAAGGGERDAVTVTVTSWVVSGAGSAGGSTVTKTVDTTVPLTVVVVSSGAAETGGVTACPGLGTVSVAMIFVTVGVTISVTTFPSLAAGGEAEGSRGAADGSWGAAEGLREEADATGPGVSSGASDSPRISLALLVS